MRAVYFEEFNALPRLAEVPTPTPSENGVVIRVEATGLCRSDWHAWAGHDSLVSLPHVPGHEFVGRIVELGPGVTRFSAGDRVTVPFVCGCGKCAQCLSGNAQVCPNQTQPGFTHWGSYAEFVAIHEADTNVIAVADDADVATVTSLGCRFATSYRALAHRARVQPGEWLAVFGCGGVGLSAIMIARALEARVIAVDVNPGALDLAKELGAEHVINSGNSLPHQVAAQVQAIAIGGADVSIDALGLEETATAAVLSLRPRGRHVQVGLFDRPPRFPMPTVVAKEIDVLGSHGMAAADYPELLALVAAGKLRPQDLVTRTIGLEDTPAALRAMSEGTTPGITLIRLDG